MDITDTLKCPKYSHCHWFKFLWPYISFHEPT